MRLESVDYYLDQIIKRRVPVQQRRWECGHDPAKDAYDRQNEFKEMLVERFVDFLMKQEED